MGAAFGGGAAAQVFGGRGAGNILTRATAICAAIFMLTRVSLAYLSSSRRPRPHGAHRARQDAQGREGPPQEREDRRRPRRRRAPLRRRTRSRMPTDTAPAPHDDQLRVPEDASTARRSASIAALVALKVAAMLCGAALRLRARLRRRLRAHRHRADVRARAEARPERHELAPLPVLDLRRRDDDRRPLALGGARASPSSSARSRPSSPTRVCDPCRLHAFAAAAGAAIASLTPWSVWLGLAPVPEGWAGACAAAALFFLAGERAMLAAVLALVASLSRYEAWPVAAFVVAVCAVRSRRDRMSIVAALVAGVGHRVLAREQRRHAR